MQGHPRFAETMELSGDGRYAREGMSAEQMLDDDFAFALELQIAGIEAMRERQGAAAEGADGDGGDGGGTVQDADAPTTPPRTP